MSTGTDFVNRWMDATNRGDMETLLAMCHADVELSNPDGTFRGADGVRALFQPYFDAVSERAVDIRNVIDAGDTVVVEFAIRGRNTGPTATPQGVVPATNKTFSWDAIGVYDLRDGKLANSRGQYDRMYLAMALGLIPQPTSTH
jgi:steroid delta-isomerase-like uncharacterized protein